MCVSKNKITAATLAGDFIGMLICLSKSVLFNISLFICGIVVGYAITATSVHVNALKNDNYECLKELQEHLEQQRILDNNIDLALEKLKLKLSHDTFAPCKSKYNYLLPKKFTENIN